MFIEWLKNLPPELVTFLIAMMPILELRGAIPIGVKVFGLSLWQAFFWSVLGNIMILVVVLLFIKRIHIWAETHSVLMHRILQYIHFHVQRQLKGKETIEGIALALFVALPLPGTGGWTGVFLAFLLDIPFRRAFPAIAIGVIVAGILMTLVVAGALKSFDFFF